MCCFSQPVDLVSDTQIFARLADEGRQLLAYSMTLGAKEDLAMVLPLPVPAGTADDAVRFINLEEYPTFFTDLNAGFPVSRSHGIALGRAAADEEPLEVVEVGAFEASFVPTVNDFDRLDARFRIPADVWAQVPGYEGYGFAVFQLKAGEQQHVHPMAFEFPTAADGLFFPTVHIHDGEFHGEADFDHVLYCQLAGFHPLRLLKWTESAQPAGMFMDLEKSQGLLDGGEHVYRRILRGTLENRDTVV
jgi:hypothetical protein